MRVVSSEKEVEAYVLGGAVLGGGGGGSISSGLEVGNLAIKIAPVEILEPKEVDPKGIVVTVSAVGVQSKGEFRPWHHVRAVELLQNVGLSIDALISSECGAFSTVNGWLQAAILGIPVLDCPCDGRAHPTGLMGCMGLHRLENYISLQSAVGGGSSRRDAVEVIVSGKLETVNRIIRLISIEAGGVVAVSRNPVTSQYALENGAPGALEFAFRVGEAMLAAGDGVSRVKAAISVLDGDIVCEGRVVEYRLMRTGGFDVGSIIVEDSAGKKFEVTFVNEYMTLEVDGERLATFPDIINLFDVESGYPLISSEVREGRRVLICKVNWDRLILGAGLKDSKLYEPIERVLGKKLLI